MALIGPAGPLSAARADAHQRKSRCGHYPAGDPLPTEFPEDNEDFLAEPMAK
jgi:hypothetical protein